MNFPRLTHQRLIALFLLGCALFNYPLLAVFNRADDIFGVPLTYLYLFGAWALLIIALALITERGRL